jgi:hypothetical protein
MSTNDAIELEKEPANELTAKQETFIAALVAGANVTVASRTAGVSLKTGQRWMKKPIIATGLRHAKQEVFESKLEVMRDGVDIAIKTLTRNMGEDARPYVQVAAASKYLDTCLDLYKMSNLEAEIAELKQLLLAKDVQ